MVKCSRINNAHTDEHCCHFIDVFSVWVGIRYWNLLAARERVLADLFTTIQLMPRDSMDFVIWCCYACFAARTVWFHLLPADARPPRLSLPLTAIVPLPAAGWWSLLPNIIPSPWRVLSVECFRFFRIGSSFGGAGHFSHSLSPSHIAIETGLTLFSSFRVITPKHYH